MRLLLANPEVLGIQILGARRDHRAISNRSNVSAFLAARSAASLKGAGVVADRTRQTAHRSVGPAGAITKWPDFGWMAVAGIAAEVGRPRPSRPPRERV